MQLEMNNTLMDNPLEVREFCQNVLVSLYDHEYEVLKEIQQEKDNHLGYHEPVQYWDYFVYKGSLNARKQTISYTVFTSISVYSQETNRLFTVHGVLTTGIFPILESMFQVYLERVTEEEELWTRSAEQITKYHVIHKTRVVPFSVMSESRDIQAIYILTCILDPANRWLVQCIPFEGGVKM